MSLYFLWVTFSRFWAVTLKKCLSRDMVSRAISTLLTLPLTVLCGLFERFCPKNLCKHFVTCRLCGSRERRCSCAALYHVVAVGCARDRILTVVCHFLDGRTVFSFQGASENVSLLSLGRNFAFLIRKLSITFPCAGHRVPRYLSLYIGYFFYELFDVFVRIHIFFTIHLYNRRNKKAPHKIELRQRIVLTRFRTALGSFSVLTDPALLARLEILYTIQFSICLGAFHFRQYDYTVHLAEKARTLFPT